MHCTALYMMGDLHNWDLGHPYNQAPNVTRVTVSEGVPSVRVTVTHDPSNPFNFDQSPYLVQSSPGAGLIDESQLVQLDTNGDGGVSAIDALVIINFLSSHDGTQGEGETPAQLDDVQQVYDSIRDGKVSVIDALQVINYLSRSNATASSESVAVSAEVAMPLLDAVNSPPEDGLDEDLIRLLADDQSRVDL